MEKETLVVGESKAQQQDTENSSELDTMNQSEILKVVEIVERDSIAIADSYTSLFSSLRLALSQVTASSVDHMQCFNEAAGRVQESALDAATKGNRFINSCLRLNEEMKSVESLAIQLKVLRRNVDVLDSAVNKLTASSVMKSPKSEHVGVTKR